VQVAVALQDRRRSEVVGPVGGVNRWAQVEDLRASSVILLYVNLAASA